MPRAEGVEADGTGGQGGNRRGTARRRLTTADAASLPRPQDLVLWSQPSWTLEDDRGIVETVEWIYDATKASKGDPYAGFLCKREKKDVIIGGSPTSDPYFLQQ